MDSMLGQNRFGAHGDVMNASPEDEAGKARLLEEIKSRARAEFGRNNLPQAEMLYSKGLKIAPEDATLHGNLAAVRLGLNKPQSALENSEEALRLDPGYVKGFYRKGNALMALSRPLEAAEAFRTGAKMEPKSKLWPPLIAKATKAAEGAPPAEAITASSNGRSAATASSRTTLLTSTNKAASSGRSTKKSGTGDSEDYSNMRGYKTTADGKVTTFFHNELSEEAKALIGDIAPKKIEADQAIAAGVENCDKASGNDVSAWNKAGTWESRDMTSWSKQRLEELLKGVDFDAPESSVTVVKVENLEGDAEISFSRGKTRYMFDFRFELKWEAPDLDEGPAKGVLVYPDFGQDCEGVYEVECRVDNSTPRAARGFVDRYVRAEGGGLRQVVLDRLVKFVEEFNSK